MGNLIKINEFGEFVNLRVCEGGMKISWEGNFLTVLNDIVGGCDMLRC